ncbi:proline iminopeptidase [Devosia yakushimensis]|uniref:Proline iminopeptidase n=1 Tax=Devosia yakushimensis TaxID=470028 RepID=A0ABQ5U978_9HYPH|nr:prolyl aminopeptidase [Devosia yakushimensis]GLQ08674.1 proline iminopeptidase [Devosia yakushimensis]
MAFHALVEPHAQGMLDVGQGHAIFWSISGNPDGVPALILHGGPGSGVAASTGRFFDPTRYRIIAFDQRGCGRSTPHAGAAGADLSANTTGHLLADIEALRLHLGVERWVLYGMSWGTTLGFAYAQRHPERVRAMVLAGITTTRQSEIGWLYRGLAPLFPAQWEAFRAGAPAGTSDSGLIAAYGDLLLSPDGAIHNKAALDFHLWEAATISSDPNAGWPERWNDPAYILARARIVTHYFRHAAWLEEGALISGASALADIPGVMVQGRLDLQAPLTTAWDMSRAWPAARLVIIEGAGHSSGDAGMGEAIVSALDGFAG